MNELNVGFQNKIRRPQGGYLWIIDKLPKTLPKPRHPMENVRVFDPHKHSFNPMEGMTPDRAEELAELIYTISPGGDGTLTVRNGRIALAKALLKAERFDKVKGNEEVTLMIESLLFSPVRRNVLCKRTDFSFNVHSVILAHLDRSELGEKTALTIGLFLMSHYQGQLIIPDLGFYGRDIHSRLVREERLIAGVSYLDELPKGLRKSVMLIEEKIVSGAATMSDAEELAGYANLQIRTIGHGEFIQGAIA